MKRGALLGVGAALAALAFAAGMLLSRPAPAPADTAPQTAPEAAGRLFAATLADPAGQPLALSRWRGKPVIVNFWATWCPPCLKEIPAFSRLQEKYPQVQFVGIAVDTAENVRDFVAKQKLSYPVLLATDEVIELMPALGNSRNGLPFTLVVDAGGKVRHTRLGALSEAETEQIIAELSHR